MEQLQNIATFISQFAGAINSVITIVANIIAISFAIFFSNIIYDFYVTLGGMNNPVGTIIFWLSIITFYGLIYRSVSAVASAISRYNASKKKAQEATHNIVRLKQTLSALSKNEIAIIKFVLQQVCYVAWLPKTYNIIIVLRQKGILRLFSHDEKSISPQSIYYSDLYSRAQLFTIPDNVRKLIAQMIPETKKKWKKIKPDHTLMDLQYPH